MKRTCFSLLLAVFSCVKLGAQWNGPSLNNLVCSNAPFIDNISGEFKYFETIGDGNGGAFVAWHDARNGSYDVFIQRINNDGSVAWTADGVNVCNLPFNQEWPKITTDGSGGVVIVWMDAASGVSVQRLDNNGNALWGANGISVPATAGGILPDVVRNENGDFTVTWKDLRNGVMQVFAQRLDANGLRLWGSNGIIVCSQQVGSGGLFTPKIISDGSNGVIITWDDQRAGDRVYAQRVQQNGVVAWTVDGVEVSTTPSSNPRICTDGSAGAIISWTDSRTGSSDIYVQRINSTGLLQWLAGGVAICTSAFNQTWQQMTMDNNGGAIIAWNDARDPMLGQLFVQHVNASGTAMWTMDGINVTTDGGGFIHLVTDGDDGAIITWAGLNIMAQHVSGDGTFNFGATGTIVCNAPGAQGSPRIASVGNGAGIVSWIDYRGGNAAIYASLVGSGGVLPVLLLEFSGYRSNNSNVLNWKTAYEFGNNSFQVQRSSDGVDFFTVGSVSGNGNTSAVHNYFFTDNMPLHGRNFYRLKQIDTDHSFEYSKVILLNRLTKIPLQVFPNPATSSITVQTKNNGNVLICDMNGRVVRSIYTKGNSTVIDVAKLASGVYQCRFDSEHVMFIKR